MALIDAIEIGDLAEEEAKKLGIPASLYRKVVLTGENYDAKQIDTDAVSPKGAKGPAQVTDATWQGLIKNGKIPKDADRTDVRTNLRAGALVLKEQLDMAGGNQAAGVAGYNAGNQANKDVTLGKMPAAKETQEYLARLGLSPQTPFLDSSDPATPTSIPLARVTTKGGTPEQKMASTAELEDMIARNRESTKMFQRALFGGTEALQAAGQAALGYGNAAADVATIQGSIDTAKLLQVQQINNVMNASVSDPDSVIVESQKKRKEAQIKMDALRPVIDAEDKVQVWDDPLRWIANQFTLPTLKREFNQAHREEKAMVQRMTQTQQLAAAQQSIDPAIIIDDVGRKAAATATGLKFKALEEASKLQANSSEYMARAIQSDMVVNDRSWEQRQQLARQYQESLSYARLTAADTKQSEADKKFGMVVDVISTKLNSIGMPSIDVGTLKTLGPKRAGELIDWAQLPTLGNGPGESMAAIRMFGSDQKVAEKDPILFKFINGLVASPDYKAIAGTKQSDAKFQHLSFQEQREQIVQEVYYKQRSDLEKLKGDNSQLPANNPYKLVHLNSALVPELQSNEFARDLGVIAASSVDKKTVQDKDILLNFLGKAQAEPNKLKDHAQALADYYTKATKYQWERGGAAITGYPKFTSYGVTDPSTGKAINVMNPLEVESWAIRRMTAALKKQHSPETVWGGGGFIEVSVN